WLNQKKPRPSRFPSLSVRWTGALRRLCQIDLPRATCLLSFCLCSSLFLLPASPPSWPARVKLPAQRQSGQVIAVRSHMRETKPTPLIFSFVRGGLRGQMGLVGNDHLYVSDQSPRLRVRVELHRITSDVEIRSLDGRALLGT